jgi:hypothetical protein
VSVSRLPERIEHAPYLGNCTTTHVEHKQRVQLYHWVVVAYHFYVVTIVFGDGE